MRVRAPWVAALSLSDRDAPPRSASLSQFPLRKGLQPKIPPLMESFLVGPLDIWVHRQAFLLRRDGIQEARCVRPDP